MRASLSSRLGAAALVLALAGCTIRGGPPTPAEQQSFGTRTFAAPYDVTFEATRDALTRLGYSLDFASTAQGRITTSRKELGAQAEIGLGGARASTRGRSYDLHISPVDPRHTRVTAIPHIYTDERDVSRERVWTRDGPEGEYALWRALFAKIEASLR